MLKSLKKIYERHIFNDDNILKKQIFDDIQIEKDITKSKTNNEDIEKIEWVKKYKKELVGILKNNEINIYIITLLIAISNMYISVDKHNRKQEKRNTKESYEKKDINIPLYIIVNAINNYCLLYNKSKNVLKQLLNTFVLVNESTLKKKHNNKELVWVFCISKSDYNIIYDYKIYDSVKKIYTKPVYNWIFIDKKNIKLNTLKKKNIDLLSISKNYFNNNLESFINEDVLEKINRIQTISYSIDMNLFIYMFETMNLSLKDFILRNRNNWLIEFKPNTESYMKHIITKNKNEYKKSDILQKLKKLANNYILNKSVIQEDINYYEISILKFLYQYVNMKYYQIYHYMLIDFRGRLYIENEYNYKQSKIIRFLVKLNNTYEYISDKKYINYFFTLQIKKVYEMKNLLDMQTYTAPNIKLIENKYNYIKLKRQGIESVVSFDATTSMLQIIGCLTKNKKLMRYTNLIKNDKREDLYDYILVKIRDFLSVNKEKQIFSTFYLNRKLVKYTIMTYIYGSTGFSIATRLNELFNINYILISDLSVICYDILKIFKDNFNVINDLKSLLRTYINVLDDDTFLEYHIFDNIIKYNPSKKTKKLFKIQKPKSIIDTEKLKKVNKLKELKKRMHDLKKYSSEKNKEIYKKVSLQYDKLLNTVINDSINITLLIESNQSSLKEKKKSLLVNIIHSLDAYVCLNVQNTLKKKYNIDVLSVHDCFITNLKYYQLCLETYNSYLYKIYKLNILSIIPDLKSIIQNKNNNLLKKKYNNIIIKTSKDVWIKKKHKLFNKKLKTVQGVSNSYKLTDFINLDFSLKPE